MTDPPAKPMGRVSKSSHVVILHNGEAQTVSDSDSKSSNSFCFIDLPHPRSGDACTFVVANGALCEVQGHKKQEPSSWLIGSAVQRDGSLLLSTPIDPLFVLLPVLDKVRDKKEEYDGYFLDIESLLTSVPALSALLPQQTLASALSTICDTRGEGSERFYRLNDAKTMAWLLCKADQVLDHVQKSQHLASLAKASQVATFQRASKQGQGSVSRSQWLDIAHGFLTEYLPVDWSQRLKAALHNASTAIRSTTQSGPPEVVAKDASLTQAGVTDIATEKHAAKAPVKQLAKTPTFGGGGLGFRPARTVDPIMAKAESKKVVERSRGLKALDKVDKRGMSSLMNYFGQPKAKKMKTGTTG